MRFGDLTNEPARQVGIKAEAVIYAFGKLNQPGKALAESIISKDFNLLLITQLPERKLKAWCYKWAVPYTQVVQVDSTLEIPDICFAHRLAAYYDTDDRVLAEVSLRGLEQVETIKWEQPLDGPPKSNADQTSRPRWP